MKLSTLEQKALKKSARKYPSKWQQINDHQGRVVAVSTVLERMRKWPSISIHDACTTPNMNFKG